MAVSSATFPFQPTAVDSIVVPGMAAVLAVAIGTRAARQCTPHMRSGTTVRAGRTVVSAELFRHSLNSRIEVQLRLSNPAHPSER
jgi:hypothetical protein